MAFPNAVTSSNYLKELGELVSSKDKAMTTFVNDLVIDTIFRFQLQPKKIWHFQPRPTSSWWHSCDHANSILKVHLKSCRSTSNFDWSTRKSAKISPSIQSRRFSKTIWSSTCHCETKTEEEFSTFTLAVRTVEFCFDFCHWSIWNVHPLENWNASKISTHDMFRAMQLSLHAAMAEPMTQVWPFKLQLLFDKLAVFVRGCVWVRWCDGDNYLWIHLNLDFEAKAFVVSI